MYIRQRRFLNTTTFFTHGLAFAGLLFGLVFFKTTPLFSSYYEKLRVFAGLLTFNSTHVLVTYVLFLLPEFKKVEYFKQIHFGLRNFFITVFWLGYYTWVYHYFRNSPFFYSTLLMPKVAMFSWHGIRQSLGLSLQQSGYVNLGFFNEHNLVLVLWLNSMASNTIYILLDIDTNLMLAVINTCLCIAFSMALLKKQGASFCIKKSAYLPRFLLFSLGVTNLHFLIFSHMLHGIEAVTTYLSMAKQSKAGNHVFWISIFILVAFIPVVAVVWHYNSLAAIWGVSLQDHTKIWLFAFSSALSTSHCFMDEIIFRFKEKTVRKHIGPLIANTSLRFQQRKLVQ